jgi:hypothetical protein
VLKLLLYIVKHCRVFIIEYAINDTNEIVSLCYAQSYFPLTTFNTSSSFKSQLVHLNHIMSIMCFFFHERNNSVYCGGP